MCYFHVVLNAKKRLNRFSKNVRDYVVSTMRLLHECILKEEFDDLWIRVKGLWIEKGLASFVEYFENTWLSGHATKWQVFQSPLGFSTTNNPLESFNGKLKKQFTYRVLQSNQNYFN